ncbi:hypothetical protein EMCRGX_G024511 [Ephydatia muelleri]|eukprot:Em0015g688a
MDIENADTENRMYLRGVKKTNAKKTALRDRLPLRTLSPNIRTGLTDTIKGRKVLRPSAETRDFVTVSVTPEEQKAHLAEKTAVVSKEETYDYCVCTDEEPPTEYWKNLAEKRAVALKSSLDENYELYKENCALKTKVLELESERMYFQLVNTLQK